MKTFHVGVKGVIVKNGKVLILRANKAQGMRDIWEVPGGRIEGEETIEETLLRELKEELLNIKRIKVHEILHADRLYWNIEDNHSLALIFYRVAVDFNGEVPRISDEHIDFKWATKEEAIELVADSNKQAIQRAM